MHFIYFLNWNVTRILLEYECINISYNLILKILLTQNYLSSNNQLIIKTPSNNQNLKDLFLTIPLMLRA